jgi:hypothetical protein
MLTCPKCGFDNELGRIFCHRCGARLNLSEIKPPVRGGKRLRKRTGPGVGRLLGRLVKLACAVALVFAVYLAWQVPAIRPIRTTGADLAAADAKRFELQQLANHPGPRTIVITEAELNAFIDSLEFEKAEGKLTLAPTDLQIEFGHGVVTVIFLGRLDVGPWQKPIFLSYTGIPTIENESFTFKPVAGAIGALPVHPWLLQTTGLFNRYFGRVFARLDREKQLLDKLSSIRVERQRVVLQYQPRGPDA